MSSEYQPNFLNQTLDCGSQEESRDLHMSAVTKLGKTSVITHRIVLIIIGPVREMVKQLLIVDILLTNEKYLVHLQTII